MKEPEEPESRAAAYLSEAVAAIDAQFGEGFARDHPDLMASLVQTQAIDAAVATGRGAHEEALTLAEKISRDTCETILKLKPRLFG
ncbi:hypothetical protein [Roseovarius indicus]|uniref:hypothetical protein n=1 Tax=Roseovarius indicus TaxID=540747 RepID=UPI0032ECC0A9